MAQNKTHAADMYTGTERHDTGGQPKGHTVTPPHSRSFYEQIGQPTKASRLKKPKR